MSFLQTKLISHSRKVCSLYKRALRNIENYQYLRHHYRYDAVMLRQRFEENRNELDMRKAKELLLLGEEELFENMYPLPRKFPHSPGGVAFERSVVPPDWVLDFWHETEKAAYPDYFEKRELRKKEYLEWWNKKYGEPTHDPHHHEPHP